MDVIATPDGSIKVAQNGATLVSWRSKTQEDSVAHAAVYREELFFSKKSQLAAGQPLRGGVPIAFPQFASQGPFPNHGFARISLWHREPSSQNKFEYRLQPAWAEWPHQVELAMHAHTGPKTMSQSFHVKNTGNEPIEFEALLHTYYVVDDLGELAVVGLEEQRYIDKTDNMTEKVLDGALRISKETDWIFEGVTGSDGVKTVQLVEETRHKSITFGASITAPDGQHKVVPCDVVVWNPWIEKSQRMADFGDDEYEHMICVEPGCVKKKVHLLPGYEFKLNQEIVVDK